ncbi:phage tail protein [Clostridium sp. CX1]|uniref:phage tail protein n=1 Tax=Clostridium sp. CX1 TaxID=2978346 RepID=UPI0021C0A59A|nr:phage tail protein [Clostridium sp. CX1]MCT8975484.1 phage tail protein [Clostridium sp. CX1]
MAEQFYTILTKLGKSKIANVSALGIKLNLVKFQVGDGGGTYYNPTEEQTQLKNKVWEGNINSVIVDENNPNWIVMETVIPADQGGFMIREAGIFDDEGNLVVIGKYPETYKPIASEGSSKDLIIRMILEVSNTASVTLKVDPTVILATKKDIQVLQNQISNIKVPVTKVNGKTGDVVLKAEDIKLNDGTTLEDSNNTINRHLADTTSGAHKASNISANVTGITGSDVQTILSNLFQYANNGKTGIANVIGSPALSSDTFEMLKNCIQNNKNTLATNLTNKGQSSVETDTLANLVSKVANINTGKRWASGSFPGPNYSGTIVTVNNLSFSPSFIILYLLDNSSPYVNGNTVGLYIKDVGLNIAMTNYSYNGLGNTGGTTWNSLKNVMSILSNGFSINFANFPMGTRPDGLRWYAFE